MPARIARLCCFTAAAVYNRGPQLQQQRKCQTAIVANVVCTITHMQQAAAIGRKVVAWSDDRSQAPIKPLTTVVQRGSATRAWCCLLLVLGGGVVMSSQVGVSTSLCATAVVAVYLALTLARTTVLCCLIRSHTASSSGRVGVVG